MVFESTLLTSDIDDSRSSVSVAEVFSAFVKHGFSWLFDVALAIISKCLLSPFVCGSFCSSSLFEQFFTVCSIVV